jgi:branched-chain amino acid transport system permease protein
MLRIITFVHGEMYMLGGYFTWLFARQVGLPFFAALFIAMGLMFVIGMGLEKVLWHPMIDDPLRCLIMSLALALVLQGAVGAILGATDKGIQSPFEGVFSVMGVRLSTERIIMVISCVAMLLLVLIFFKKHKIGLAMQAVALDPLVSALQGIPVEKIQRIGFGFGCALAGFAGGLIGTIFSINPIMGLTPIIKAFVVVVLGGLGSIPGTIFAGLIIGMLDSFSTTFFGSLGNIFAFVIFIIVLLVRPRGLLGYEV